MKFWPGAIIVFLAIVVIADVALLIIAVRTADPVVESYAYGRE